MRTRCTHLLLALVTFSLALATAGCECSGPTPHGTACTSNGQCHAPQLCIDGTCRTPTDGGPSTLDANLPDTHHVAAVPVSVAISPSMATLSSVDGSRPTQAFTATITYDDGSMSPATVTDWSIDARQIGDVDPGVGTFTANGVVGGTGTITVAATTSHGTLMATAMIEVVLTRTVMGAGVPADVATTFAGATAVTDPSRESNLVYPLDQSVMPQNVYPADLQWTRGNAGELVRVTLTKPSITVTAYLVDDASHHWLADADAWRSLAQTNPDVAATMRVDHIDGTTMEMLRGTDVSVTFARAALTGSVYYWAIAQGRIIRIDDGTATRVSFMPSPEQGCVGCHSVSPSGRYMIGRFGGGDNVGTVFDLTTDLTGSPPASLWPGRTTTWWMSSWSPDETRAVVTYQEGGTGGQLRMMDPFTGAYIDPAGMPRGTHPAWSHDGTRIAYSANTNGWGGGYSNGDIAILPVTAPDTVGASTVIQHGTDLASSTPAGNASAYPSWSPGDTAIAFAHGTGPRSETDQSALYIMAPDGSGVVRLDAANGGTTLNYQPRFSPFTQGGYFWLSFLSRRDYGNSVAGTAGTSRQQIWVTAISTTGTTGAADPSRAAYWLPGQDTASQNISAFWAPRACREDGSSCTVGSECCGGECTPDSTGALVCTPPPPERCHHASETCTTDADCCSTEHLVCIGHVCESEIM
jgi:hypothetical protein